MQTEISNYDSWVVLKKRSDEESEKTFGPYTTKELKQKLKSKEFEVSDFCWKESWTSWKPIYEVEEFSLTRKPPLKWFKAFASTSENLENSVSDFHEIPKKIRPLQYKDWKYKKTSSNEEGVMFEMLDPWIENKTKKNESFPSQPQNEPEFLNESEQVQTIKLSFSSYGLTKTKVFVMMLSFILVFIAILKIFNFSEPHKELDLSLSYMVIDENASDLPKYMYLRTDLKKGKNVKLRIFDSEQKLYPTRNKKSGLHVTSKGTGRLRLPLYPYDFAPGVYTLSLQAQKQTVEKEFIIDP